MLTAIPRCDHCDAILRVGRVERDRKRFCCLECLRAFERGELKAISPHDHSRLAGAPVTAGSGTTGPGRRNAQPSALHEGLPS